MVADPLAFTEFPLTPTERRIWDLLRAHPGRVFSRKELITQVMPGTVVLPRTIDVHIRGLRKKLPAALRHVQTVRGRGYTFVEHVD